MQFLFGDWFICLNEDTARKLSDKKNNILAASNCITVKGDMYRSDGTLSGGDTSKSGGNRLLEIHNYLNAEKA